MNGLSTDKPTFVITQLIYEPMRSVVKFHDDNFTDFGDADTRIIVSG